MIVVGTKKVDFKDKEGNEIQGLNVYVQYPEDYVDGVATDKLFLSRGKFSDIIDIIAPGCVLNVLYNKYGKISHVIIE